MTWCSRMAPEDRPPTKAMELFGGDHTCVNDVGAQAIELATQMLGGQRVTFVFDRLAGDRDSFGRLLAYVHVAGRDFNALLVELGYARVRTESKASRMATYLGLQERAREQGLGIWQCVG